MFWLKERNADGVKGRMNEMERWKKYKKNSVKLPFDIDPGRIGDGSCDISNSRSNVLRGTTRFY